jgi:hypothetical protein
MTEIKIAQAWGHERSPSALLHHAGEKRGRFTVPYLIVHGLTEAELRELLERRGEVERLLPIARAFAMKNGAPCAICGYRGPSYYQPDVHKCAAAPTEGQEGRA